MSPAASPVASRRASNIDLVSFSSRSVSTSSGSAPSTTSPPLLHPPTRPLVGLQVGVGAAAEVVRLLVGEEP